MRPNMLFHVIFSRKSLIADRAMNAFFTGMLLSVAGSMAGGCEGGCAPVAGSIRTRVLVLPARSAGTSLSGF